MKSSPIRRALPVRRFATVTALSVVATVMPVHSATASDTATRWDRISESSECGDPFTRTPFVSKIGTLGNGEAILGPFGTYFGRSISEVRTHLAVWTVPYSGGIRIQVHEAMLPSLQRVTTGLRAHAAEGRVYDVHSAGGFTSRSIGGRYHVSRHALGLAIDINAAQNPYRSDDALISDMPGWYVQTWREAGFCWGGDWRGSKDPMHFSWMGPGSTPSTTDTITPIPPTTSKTGFRGPVANHQTEFAPVMSRYSFTLADANSNGAPDVVGLRTHPDGAVLDVALSPLGYGYCSIGRSFIEEPSVGRAEHMLLADFDGDGAQDLIALSPSGESLGAKTATKRSRFEDISANLTGAGADALAVAGADFDADHHADLWEATPGGTLRIWRGPAFTDLVNESPLPEGPPEIISAGDRDGGDTPELYALYPAGDASRIDVLTHDGSWSRETSITLDAATNSVEAIGAGDYDGDGRADAQILTTEGDLGVFIGNSPTGIPNSRWFMYPEWECNDPVLVEYAGSFMDDETSVFVNDIESIAASGVTKGCNPPFNDRFCPEELVSRGQMAAFLVRALAVTANSHDRFTDVAADSTFVEDIGRLATAGITRGCNPPANDEFCPEAPVTRGQMAAFLVRALGLTGDTHDGFTDVPATSTFAKDIEKLASADITRGCNPPVNDEFCPADPVTRGQMAAFLARAQSGK